MRAALYARVSTAHQEQEETIASQIEEVKQRIELDGNTLLPSLVFTDEGYSGSLLERPALDKMLDSAKSKEFDVLYIYDLGRLSRSLSHLLIVIEQLEKYERHLVSLHERITGTPEDKFLLQIMGSMHEYERAKIAERFRRGKMYKARSGKIVGYNAPYGYRYDKENGTFSIHEPEARVVRMMFNWVANEGLSSYGAMIRLNELGVPTPKGVSHTWGRTAVSRTLNNETYFGKHHFNKSESILPRYKLNKDQKYHRVQKTGRRKRPREDWIEFEVPAIVTKDLFSKAKAQLAKNIIFNPKNKKYPYLLTGLIQCTCGASRSGNGPAGKKYYRCSSRHQNHLHETTCKVGGINVVVADALVWQKLASFLSDPEQIREQAEAWLKSQNAPKTSIYHESLKEELRELENEQERYVSGYGKGLIPEDMFEQKMKEVNRHKEQLTASLSEESKNRGKTAKIHINQLIEVTTQKIDNLEFEQKKFIVERVVDKIIASPQEITIWGHLPVPSVTAEKVNYGSQYRNGKLLNQLPRLHFQLTVKMPKTDLGKRGYSIEYTRHNTESI